MHPRAAEFAERAAETYDFDVTVEEFPEGTKTAADAAEAVGCEVAQIVKSIVMVADGDPVVVLTSGANRVDEDALAAELGAETVRSANPDEVSEATGWSIGGVPPICHETPTETLFDESLAAFDEVWCAAGTPEAVFPIDPDTLQELADPRPTTAVE